MADHLPQMAFDAGYGGIVATTARAWIDLNRSEQDFDPNMFEASPLDIRAATSAAISTKVRGGLGLIPRRIAAGDIWGQKLSVADKNNRIEDCHRPYHCALEAMIGQAKAQFGVAILLDIHSMPPLKPSAGQKSPDIIIGDRFGHSAHDRYTALIKRIAQHHALNAQTNHPYAGGYILERHGNPKNNVHALQIEICRNLYLDNAFDQTGDGLANTQNFICEVAHAINYEALRA